jgi:3-deoxy-D-arabino-heptulosonate 7-phosphate (DAHP) synthase
VRERSLYGTSHFPEGRDQVYEIKPERFGQSVTRPNMIWEGRSS